MLRPFALLLLAAVVLLASPADPLLENDYIRVIKAVDAPHKKGPPHQHAVNRVMIYLQSGKQEIVADGKTTVLDLKAGEVRWSPATGTHTSEIVTDTPVSMIEIELKKPGDPAKVAANPLDPIKTAPGQAKLEFENPQVRVLRVKIPPKGTLPMHEHTVNKVTVTLTAQKERVTTADGHVDEVEHPAGYVSFSGPVRHREESLSDKPTEVIVVELKN